MSAKPYTSDEIEAIRRFVECVPGGTFGRVEEPTRWLATVDALRARLAAAEAERDDLRRYRKSWDKELRDARDAARAAIDGRIAAEAEAERARGLLQRWLNDDAGESFEVYRTLVDETQAHLASRPEGEVRHG